MKYQLWRDFYKDDMNIWDSFPYHTLPFLVVFLSPGPSHHHCSACQPSSCLSVTQANVNSVFWPTDFLPLTHSSLYPTSMIHAQFFLFPVLLLGHLLNYIPSFIFFSSLLVTTHPIYYSFIPAKHLRPSVKLSKKKIPRSQLLDWCYISELSSTMLSYVDDIIDIRNSDWWLPNQPSTPPFLC